MAVTRISSGIPVIEATGLRKRYGRVTAVDGVDLVVNAGEIFGILGPNGAGKTTTLEMIEGLRQPDEGSITLGGFDSRREPAQIRPIIGVQLQTTALFDYLSCRELIELFAGLYGAPGGLGRIDQLLGMVGLTEKRDARVHQLSGGQQQRLSFALGLVNNPKVAFLDEPTTGLDPAARRDLWQTIRDVRAAGTTVVLTTHYMEEAQTLCDRVAIMDYGRIIALDTPQSLIRSLGSAATIGATVGDAALQRSELLSLPGVITVAVEEGEIFLSTNDVQATLIGLLDLAARHGSRLADLRSSQSTLEDVFLSLTGRAYEAQNAGEEAAVAGKSGRRRRSGKA